ncbi:MAG: OapB/ArvB family protein [Candidatus Woesearchaeota archaeon]
MLTIQYLPYIQIESLSSTDRVNKILSLLKAERIVIIDGKLTSQDEALLIRITMSIIDDVFNGVEIGVMHDNNTKSFILKIKHRIAKALIGDSSGITIIGPAKILSELRQHPENLELHFQKEFLLKHSKKNITKKI